MLAYGVKSTRKTGKVPVLQISIHLLYIYNIMQGSYGTNTTSNNNTNFKMGYFLLKYMINDFRFF